MATPASIERRKLEAMKRIMAVKVEQVGPEAKKRLDLAWKRRRRNEAILYEEIAELDELGHHIRKVDHTPLEGNLEGINERIIAQLKERGIVTKDHLRRTPDGELFKLSGVGPSVVRRMRAQI